MRPEEIPNTECVYWIFKWDPEGEKWELYDDNPKDMRTAEQFIDQELRLHPNQAYTLQRVRVASDAAKNVALKVDADVLVKHSQQLTILLKELKDATDWHRKAKILGEIENTRRYIEEYATTIAARVNT